MYFLNWFDRNRPENFHLTKSKQEKIVSANCRPENSNIHSAHKARVILGTSIYYVSTVAYDEKVDSLRVCTLHTSWGYTRQSLVYLLGAKKKLSPNEMFLLYL